MRRTSILLPVVLFAAAACASSGARGQDPSVGAAPAEGAAARQAAGTPLAELAAQRIVVVPAQRIRAGDSLGFAAAAGDARTYLATLDEEIGFALSERGLAGRWAMPADVVRSTRRSPTMGVDARSLPAGELRAGVRREHPDLSVPLASQLRAIVALHDARYALVPGELRFEGAPGAGRAVLHLVLVDARLGQVVWEGDVSSDPAPELTPALAASVAGRLADLIAAP